MSFHILNTGASALTAAQRAVETAAHNAANSTVDGYTRQRVSQAAMIPAQGANGVLGSGHRGTGVQVVSIDRLRDVLADLALRAESGKAGAEGARAEVLDRAQGVLGAYGNGLPDALSKMWAAFDQLALAPAEPAARQILVDSAVTVATGLNDAAAALQRIRADALKQAESEVQEVNNLAAEVANLNTHIVAARNGGQAPNDLMDRRDLLLDKLSSLVGATSRPTPDGAVNVSMGGAPLVQGSSAFSLSAVTSTNEQGLEGAELSLKLHGNTVLPGGSLGGRVAVLAQDLRAVERALDEVAQVLASEVNAVHMRGYDLNGAPGQEFFTKSGPQFRASDFQVNSDVRAPGGLALVAAASSPDGVAFNGENALQLARVRSGQANQALNGVAAMLGSRASAALAAAETANTAVASLRDQRGSANGVSLDEEMVQLVKFQHSYDAAARVISIADEMLNTLINRMGAGR